MQKLKYYLEYATQRARKAARRHDLGSHRGTVVAVIQGTAKSTGVGVKWDCYRKDSRGIHRTEVSEGYLRNFCVKVSVDTALEIHPELINHISSHGE